MSIGRHTADSLPHRFAALRLAVGFLGQADSSSWWSSSFLSPNGLAVCQYNFPRAFSYAALSATDAAAKRLHDERIGERRCVHLFRLALADEMLIQRTIQDEGRALLDQMPLGREDAINIIESEQRKVISVDAGPVQIGNATDAFSDDGLGELANHYSASFRQSIQCLPYFANLRR